MSKLKKKLNINFDVKIVCFFHLFVKTFKYFKLINFSIFIFYFGANNPIKTSINSKNQNEKRV